MKDIKKIAFAQNAEKNYMEHLDKVVLFAVDVLNMLIIAIFAVKNLESMATFMV